MSTQWIRSCVVAACVICILILSPIPSAAQEPTPENDQNCVGCHEHQYYLYDSGKWFCLCDAPMHCVYCHNGRTDSLDKDVAHEGLVLYPTANEAERCQQCHPADYAERVVTFASVAGISNTPQPLITATPSQASLASSTQALPPPWYRLSHLAAWQTIGLSATLVAMAILIFLGYRCWRADCLANRRT